MVNVGSAPKIDENHLIHEYDMILINKILKLHYPFTQKTLESIIHVITKLKGIKLYL